MTMNKRMFRSLGALILLSLLLAVEAPPAGAGARSEEALLDLAQNYTGAFIIPETEKESPDMGRLCYMFGVLVARTMNATELITETAIESSVVKLADRLAWHVHQLGDICGMPPAKASPEIPDIEDIKANILKVARANKKLKAAVLESRKSL